MSLQKLFSNEGSTIFVKTGHLIDWLNQAITYLVNQRRLNSLRFNMSWFLKGFHSPVD